MKAIAVTTTHPAETFSEAGMDLIVESLTEVNAKVVQKIIVG